MKIATTSGPSSAANRHRSPLHSVGIGALGNGEKSMLQGLFSDSPRRRTASVRNPDRGLGLSASRLLENLDEAGIGM